MDDKQQKIKDQIKKKEEELKALKIKEAKIRKQEKLKAEKEKDRWYGNLKKELDLMFQAEIGNDYRELLDIPDLVKIVRSGITSETKYNDGSEAEKHGS